MQILRTLILIPFFVGFGFSQASIGNIDDLIKQASSHSKYVELIENLDSLISAKEIWLKDSIHRKVEDIYFQSIYEIEIKEGNFYSIGILGKGQLLELNIYKIIHSDFFGNYRKIKRKVFVKRDNKGKKEYQNAVANRLGENYLKIVTPNKVKEIVTVGLECGLGRGKTQKIRQMLLWVNMRNQIILRAWCKSEIPEIRLCGIIGLKVLEVKGITLRKKSNNIMQKVSSEKLLVQTCHGCVYRGNKISMEDVFSGMSNSINRLVEK